MVGRNLSHKSDQGNYDMVSNKRHNSQEENFRKLVGSFGVPLPFICHLPWALNQFKIQDFIFRTTRTILDFKLDFNNIKFRQCVTIE